MVYIIVVWFTHYFIRKVYFFKHILSIRITQIMRKKGGHIMKDGKLILALIGSIIVEIAHEVVKYMINREE